MQGVAGSNPAVPTRLTRSTVGNSAAGALCIQKRAVSSRRVHHSPKSQIQSHALFKNCLNSCPTIDHECGARLWYSTMPNLLGGRIARNAGVVAALALVGSCAAKTRPDTSRVLSVAGTYQTQVTLVAGHNTCGAVTVQDNPTEVAQVPGAHTLSLTHANNAYPGVIDSTAHFTAAGTLTSGGSRYTITISGQFSARGFDASVQVDVQQTTAPQSCSYLVHWVGTKSGSPNTFP